MLNGMSRFLFVIKSRLHQKMKKLSVSHRSASLTHKQNGKEMWVTTDTMNMYGGESMWSSMYSKDVTEQLQAPASLVQGKEAPVPSGEEPVLKNFHSCRETNPNSIANSQSLNSLHYTGRQSSEMCKENYALASWGCLAHQTVRTHCRSVQMWESDR